MYKDVNCIISKSKKPCIVCGKLTNRLEKHINGIIFVNVDEQRKYYGHGIIDLCPDCSTEFINRFQNGGETNGRGCNPNSL